MLLTSCMSLVGCIDSNFDLSDVDATVGVGTESLTLPGSNSTKEILLDDVLELNNSDFITTLDNGDYVLRQNGDDVEPSIVTLNAVDVKEANTQNYDLVLDLPDNITSIPFPMEIPPVTAAMDVKVFEYEGAHTDDVLEVITAEVNSELDLFVEFSEALMNTVPVMDYM